MEVKRGRKVEKTGTVVSSKMDKSRVVLVETRVQHHFYKKVIKKHKRIMVHDESGLSKEGDVVKIMQCRPLSKCKCWIVKEVLEKGAREENGSAYVSSAGSR